MSKYGTTAEMENTYKLLAGEFNGTQELDNLENGTGWMKLWKAMTPNKVKVFSWRLQHDALPVRANLENEEYQQNWYAPDAKNRKKQCNMKWGNA